MYGVKIKCVWISTKKYDAKPYPVGGFENRQDEIDEALRNDKPFLAENLKLYWKCLDMGAGVELVEIPEKEVEQIRLALIETIKITSPHDILKFIDVTGIKV